MNHKSFSLFLKNNQKRTLQTPTLMETFNVTPDSFYDGGAYFMEEQQRQKKISLLKTTKASIIDVGGESSRPGAVPIDPHEEMNRVLPVIKQIKRTCPDLLISIDTMKPVVAKKAVLAGADIINDVSAGNHFHQEMFDVAAEMNTPLILMHMQNTPLTMQQNPVYKNVVQEVLQFLQEKIELARQAGLSEEQIIVDPGIGFGKNKQHNLLLIQHLKDFKALGYPVLVGASMKQIINDITGAPLQERLPGTLGLHLAAICNGCDIVRMHHIQAMHDSIQTFTAGIQAPYV